MNDLFLAPDQPRICACGCGKPLPSGSTRTYKNGHKPDPDPVPVVQEQSLTGPADEWFDSGEGPWTYDQAAQATDPDPDPATMAADKPKVIKLPEPKPQLHLTKQQKADIQAKITFWLELGGAMLSPLDDVCVPVFAEQTPRIAAAMLPLVAQSPEVAAWFMKAGNFALWADLAMACWPVISVIIAHHVTKTRQADRQTHPNGLYFPADAYSTETGYAA